MSSRASAFSMQSPRNARQRRRSRHVHLRDAAMSWCLSRRAGLYKVPSSSPKGVFYAAGGFGWTNFDMQPPAHFDRDTWGGSNGAKDAPFSLKIHGWFVLFHNMFQRFSELSCSRFLESFRADFLRQSRKLSTSPMNLKAFQRFPEQNSQ